jgi:RHS repeat-associated protein
VRDYVNGNSVNAGDHWTEVEVWGYGTVTYVGNYFEWTGSTGTMLKHYYAGGTRVAMRRGASSLYWMLGDHLGSQAITADANGGKISEVRYYPWGTDRYSAYTSSSTYRFTGQRTEFGFGLYYYGARWYDPYLNRWIQPDSIIPDSYNSQSYDRYAYRIGNSIR